jgi:hypothetical protein
MDRAIILDPHSFCPDPVLGPAQNLNISPDQGAN